MSSKSFDKAFVVSDEADIQRFKAKLNRNHQPVIVKPRDAKQESKKGIELLKNFW